MEYKVRYVTNNEIIGMVDVETAKIWQVHAVVINRYPLLSGYTAIVDEFYHEIFIFNFNNRKVRQWFADIYGNYIIGLKSLDLNTPLKGIGMFGYWKDIRDNKQYFDEVTFRVDKQRAIEIGKENNQKSITR